MVSQKPIIFAGSPDFAVPALKGLCADDYSVDLVLTQPDRPAGRGRQLQPSPVKQTALDLDLPVLQPERINQPDVLDRLRSLEPQVMIVVAYGQILGPEVLALPPRGCVNVHASLLPRWRGASPIQAAIMAGDPETGISIMAMEAGLDSGPVYRAEPVRLSGEETGRSLHDELARMGARVLLETLPGILDGSLAAQPQAADGASYAPRITRADAAIDWQRSAVQIERQIRALDPWPVAETRMNGEVLRCWQAVVLPGSSDGAEPGAVLAAADAGLDVATGDGVLRVMRLQRPGRKPMDAAEFLRGFDMSGRLLGR